MPRPTATITFVHVDPTEALVQMLVVDPLAADPGNMAFFCNPGLQSLRRLYRRRQNGPNSEQPPGRDGCTEVGVILR